MPYKYQLNLLKPNKSSPRRKIIISFLILVFIFSFFVLFNNSIKNYFYSLTSPVSKSSVVSGNYFSSFLSSVFNSTSINQDNKNLKKENERLRAEIINLKGELSNNLASSEIIEKTKTDNFNLYLVHSVRLDASNNTILIDEGTSSGIFEGMPVISAEKVLYGKVIKSYNDFSQVRLLSNEDSVLDIQIRKSENNQSKLVYGVLRGEGNLSAYLDLLPSSENIADGDIIETSALGGVFPKNLLVGKITSRQHDDLKPFQTANIQLFLDIKNLENLFVVKNYLVDK